MKTLTLALALILAATGTASATGVRGAGASSCTEWSQDRQTVEDWFPYVHWMQGYLSAYNAHVYRGDHANGVFGDKDYKTLLATVDAYCTANPASTVAAAMPGLVRTLKGQ